MNRTCQECRRVFDLHNADDAAEWSYGHDCETTITTKQGEKQ